MSQLSPAYGVPIPAPTHGPLRVGVGGPVGSGKTALVERLCKRMRGAYDLAVVTNDIYTKEDAEFLTRAGALAPERIMGVETGGCPHTAIREDASINLAALSDMCRLFPRLDLIFVEDGRPHAAQVNLRGCRARTGHREKSRDDEDANRGGSHAREYYYRGPTCERLYGLFTAQQCLMGSPPGLPRGAF